MLEVCFFYIDGTHHHDPMCYTHSEMSNTELLLAVQISKKKAGSLKERIAFLISVFGVGGRCFLDDPSGSQLLRGRASLAGAGSFGLQGEIYLLDLGARPSMRCCWTLC